MSFSKEAVVLCLDVSAGMQVPLATHSSLNVGEGDCKPNLDPTSALDLALDFASRLVKQRIFFKSQDFVGLILFGSDTTLNPLSDDESSYANVYVARELDKVTWDFVRLVKTGVEAGSDYTSDYYDALVVATVHLDQKLKKRKFAKSIWIVTDGKSAVDVEEDGGFERVIGKLTNDDIRVNFIGPSSSTQDDGATVKDGDDMREEERRSKDLMCQIANKTNGVIMNFDVAYDNLRLTSYKSPNTMPVYKGTFDVGSKFSIAVKMVPRIKEAKAIGFKRISNLDKTNFIADSSLVDSKGLSLRPDIPSVVRRQTTYKDISNEREYTMETLQRGYQFGSERVMLPTYTEDAMAYESVKGLSLIVFTAIENVPRRLLMSETIAVVPCTDDPHAYVALSSIIHALAETKRVAIVRLVRKEKSQVELGVMRPRIKDEYECLLFHKLPYADDIRNCNFPSFNTSQLQPVDVQNTLMDELIDSMDLTNASVDIDGDAIEAFQPKNTLNPCIQHQFNVICATETEDSNVMDDYLKQSLAEVIESVDRIPAFIAKNDKIARALEDKYQLKKKANVMGRQRVKENTFLRDRSSDLDMDLPDETVAGNVPTSIVEATNEITSTVGTVDPTNDFRKMIAHRIGMNRTDIDSAIMQIKDVIEKLVGSSISASDLVKPLDCIKLLRGTCKTNGDADTFNKWLKKYKTDIEDPEEHGYSFWKLLVENGLSLLSREETGVNTDPTAEEAELFLGPATVEPILIPEVPDDVEDLMDEFD
eukprot:CFRG5535T1